jgi:hypothetical protein
MSVKLIDEIDAFLAEFGISEYHFGRLAANNGRLVERLRGKGRIWPDTEENVRKFIASERQRRRERARRKGKTEKQAEAAA